MDNLGDKYQYLLKCFGFDSQHEHSLKAEFTQCANTFKIKDLMNSDDTADE